MDDPHSGPLLAVELQVKSPLWSKYYPRYRQIFPQVLQQCMFALKWPPSLKNLEVSLILTHDTDIRMLNAQYRGKDKPTNVLSFPPTKVNYKNGKGLVINEGYAYLGDIVLAIQTIIREAESYHKTSHDHGCHLLIHGFLHLYGYDHEIAKEEKIMQQKEIEILNHLGITSPYL